MLYLSNNRSIEIIKIYGGKMNLIKEFYEIMETQNDIALATSVNNTPNVRLISFYFCPIFHTNSYDFVLVYVETYDKLFPSFSFHYLPQHAS